MDHSPKLTILFLMRSAAHFTYHETTIRSLCARGHEIQLLFDEKWTKGKLDKNQREQLDSIRSLQFDWAKRREDKWRGMLFTIREILSYASYLKRNRQDPYYVKRWEKYLPSSLQVGLRVKGLKYFLKSHFFERTLKKLESRIPPDARILSFLQERRPDLVIATPLNLRYSEEIEYVKAAKALQIKTVGLVLSWDNLSTKGLFHIVPDRTLVWNEMHKYEAQSIHGIPESRIDITGSPFFDKWFHYKHHSNDRDLFCFNAGLTSEKPFILYLGSSKHIAKDETWIIRELAKQFPQVNFLVRPHGANQKVFSSLSEGNVVVWLRNRELPDQPDSLHDFSCALHEASVVMGINTTAMLDALIVNRPVIALQVGEYQHSNATRAIHYQKILEQDVYEVTHSIKETVTKTQELLRGIDARQTQRKQFIRRFIRPRGLGRDAGEVAARSIEAFVSGLGSAEEKSVAN